MKSRTFQRRGLALAIEYHGDSVPALAHMVDLDGRWRELPRWAFVALMKLGAVTGCGEDCPCYIPQDETGDGIGNCGMTKMQGNPPGGCYSDGWLVRDGETPRWCPLGLGKDMRDG